MIREFITQSGVGFFTRIEEDYLEDPKAFLERARQMVGEYAPPLGEFIRWGMNAAPPTVRKKSYFANGALMMLEAMHRFDAMSGGDAEFFAKLRCLSDEFCARNGASLCDCLIYDDRYSQYSHDEPRASVPVLTFYGRSATVIFATNCALHAFLRKYGDGMESFELGALAVIELFFRFEEQGLMMPEKNLLN